MNKHTKALRHDLEQLAEDARALLAATADIAGEKIAEARKRMTDALDRGKLVVRRAEDESIGEANAAARCVLEHPYQSIVLGIALGAVVGWAAASCPAGRRC